MSLSVIIPSKTDSNLAACLQSIWDHDSCRQIVVDDGLDADFWYRSVKAGSFDMICGDKPFIFSRNINIGIRAAGNDDVVLLNDDALLQTPGGFTAMQRAAQEHPEHGLISATTNVASASQKPQGIGLREDPRTVAFVCVFIPRRTIELVGMLDERFGGHLPDGRRIYGWEDNDYCRRVRNAGLKLGIFDACYVDHGSLRSTFRGDPRAHADIGPGAEMYRAKWGDLV